MNRQEYIKAIKDVIYLCYCALNEHKPVKSRLDKMNMDYIYEASQKHMLVSVCAMALESAGIRDERFVQAMGKAMRKNAQLDIDRAQILDRFEDAGIWYMPLKGSLLKDIYPRYGMRQMSDNDILFDNTRAENVKNIMEGLGFTTKEFGHGNHDVYFKKPVSNFEMHRELFSDTHISLGILDIIDYYRNVRDRLVKDEGNEFGYHFTCEDFYIYMLAHEYKHYVHGGTGLRSVVDVYVYLREYADRLDMGYIEEECKKLGIGDFEKQSRRLAMDLFGGEKLSDEDKQMLVYIVSSGTYGNLENMVNNKIDKLGGGRFVKVRYAISRLSIPLDENDPRYLSLKNYYPWFFERKRRLPLLFFYRLLRGVTSRRKTAVGELKVMLGLK